VKLLEEASHTNIFI